MDISGQGVSPKAGVQTGASGDGKSADVGNRASLAGKSVHIHAPDIAGLALSEGASKPARAGSTAGCFSVDSRHVEESICDVSGSEVAGAESTAEKVPEALVLKEYKRDTHALEQLTGLEKKKQLGKGAWGEVYKAERADGKPLAVKINSENDKESPSLEANPNKYDVAALLLPDHPNVMKNHSVLVGSKQHTNSYGIITHPDQLPAGAMESLYIAMVVSEFANGETLSDTIKRYAVSCRHLIVIARQLAGALAHMHKHGFAHRDVSTNNVLYHSKHGLKLIDMGSMIKTTGRAGSYVGTSQLLDVDGYDPRDINRQYGFDYDARALDSWGLGCVLFYCLTGMHIYYYRPFFDDFKSSENTEVASKYVTYFAEKDDSSKKMILQKHLKPGLWQKGLDPVMNIVVELLRANPAERPSAEDVEKRLSRLKGNPPLQSKKPELTKNYAF